MSLPHRLKNLRPIVFAFNDFGFRNAIAASESPKTISFDPLPDSLWHRGWMDERNSRPYNEMGHVSGDYENASRSESS